MQILVLSDTHGKHEPLARVVQMHPTVECVVHLGDSEWSEEILAAAVAPLPLAAVGGNCDASGYFGLRVLSLGEKRILLAHGHRQGVKFGSVEGLVALAAENNADIVLYGHTHTASETWAEKPDGSRVYLCNPGSLGEPRDGAPSFGILTLQNGEALFSVGRL